MNSNKQKLTGNLFVSGKDHILIELDGNPTSVSVNFKQTFRRRHHHNNPCNPHQDELHAQAVEVLGKFFLRIEWNVAGTRQVIWVVQY